ncbi:hypothetical protein [Lysinibacillus fusiformis]|uniref:hypothetical protein n=1 Tax=Lysinibacillus fusiformis TaxID=28031 RepID=UPI003D008995
MSRSHGKDAYFAVDDSGGTLRNISSNVNNVSGLPSARALSDVTAFTDAGERFIPGLQGAQFTVTGNADDTATTGTLTVLNGLRTASATSSFEYGPQSNTSGKVKYSGECWLENLTVDASVTDKVPFSAQFRMDNGLTVGTF